MNVFWKQRVKYGPGLLCKVTMHVRVALGLAA